MPELAVWRGWELFPIKEIVKGIVLLAGQEIKCYSDLIAKYTCSTIDIPGQLPQVKFVCGETLSIYPM